MSTKKKAVEHDDDARAAQRELAGLGGEVIQHLEEVEADIQATIRVLRGLAAARRFDEMHRAIHSLESSLDLRERIAEQLQYLKRLRDQMDEWGKRRDPPARCRLPTLWRSSCP